MFDRTARNRLSHVIKSYLNEEITAFQFDDELCELASRTEDRTAQHVVGLLWYHYDDCKDHNVVATKEEWDYFHRLLLLLETDGELAITKVRMWSVRQLIAACTLGVFILVALYLDWGVHLFATAIPFGVVSILLSRWHASVCPTADRMEIALTPFSSVSELLSARRRATQFSKEPYPHTLTSRRIRSDISEKIMWLAPMMMWLVFGPVALLFQMMPQTHKRTAVRLPQDVCPT